MPTNKPEVVLPPHIFATLNEVERHALDGVIGNLEYEAGDVEDSAPSRKHDEAAYWAYHAWHAINKLRGGDNAHHFVTRPAAGDAGVTVSCLAGELPALIHEPHGFSPDYAGGWNDAMRRVYEVTGIKYSLWEMHNGRAPWPAPSGALSAAPQQNGQEVVAGVKLLNDVERNSLNDLLSNLEHEAGDVEDLPPSIEDDDAYWPYHQWHAITKLLRRENAPVSATQPAGDVGREG